MQKENSREQGQFLQEEIEKRLREMEGEAYRFPRRFSAGDYMAVGAVALTCLLFLILGAYL